MRHKSCALFALFLILTILTPAVGSAATSPVNGNDIFLPMVVNSSKLSGMIRIPAGEFQMGCDPDHNDGYNCWLNELPLHSVYLDEYFIDKYEVTNAQMAEFLNNHGSNNCGGYECVDLDDSNCRISWNGSQYVVETGYGDHPVIQVTWYGADAYCAAGSKRLPTEAQWEKAARGTSVRAYPWGDQSPSCSLTNYSMCLGIYAPVGSYPTGASPYGVMDMAGNVWEWVADWYSSSYYSISPYENPPGPGTDTYKVMRGGSWNSDAFNVRCAGREYSIQDVSSSNIGFRCAFE